MEMSLSTPGFPPRRSHGKHCGSGAPQGWESRMARIDTDVQQGDGLSHRGLLDF